MPGHLQEEEGVSRGFPLKFRDRLRLALRESPADRGLQQRGDGIATEAAQREGPAVDVAWQGGQDGRKRAPLQFLVAVHGHGQQRRGTPGLHQVREQVEGGLVRPLQVVEDEQHRMPGAHPLEPRVQRLEQPEALGLGRGEGRGGGGPDPLRVLGEQAGDFPGQVTQVPAQQRLRAGPRVISQRLPERPVRGGHPLNPPAVQHEALLGARVLRQPCRERCLPDPRLPADEREDAAACPCARPRLPQEGEFPLTVHEVPAGRGLDPHGVRGISVVSALVRLRPLGLVGAVGRG